MGEGSRSPEPARLGRYQLLRKIAVGGMAEIYLARVSGVGGFEKDVVVKRILPQLAESDEFFAMFLDEARIAATLQHPNVVQIFDAGQAGNDFFIAMEYLDGADLHTVRRVLSERQREMPLQHAVYIVSSIAAGLHYAHERLGLDGRPLDIVHRDVTPHNVFLTREGGVKLVDFGIATAANRMSSTTYGTLKGKLAYMSPEQCRAEPVDRRSDVYSLGILLYELTTGRRLYRGKSEYELLREIVEGVVPPPSQVVASYPGDLEAIVMRALARDRAARYPNALAMEQDLERFARRHAVVGSTLAMAEFLAPVLDEAQREAEARHRRRMSSAPPPFISPGEAPRQSEGDRQETVAGQPPSRHERMGTAPTAARRDFATGPRRRPQTTPLPERVRGVTPGPDELLPDGLVVRLRPRRALPALLLLLLVVTGGAVVLGHEGAEPRVSAAPPAPRPEFGAVLVTSDPPGAAVWLALGPSPALSGPLDPARAHRVRIEHDGYRPRDLLVEPEAFRTASVGQEAAIAVDLGPAADDDAAPSEPATMPAGAAGAAAGRIRVSSQPAAAGVWLLVGVTPARIAPLATGLEVELRVAKDGYLPAFLIVAPERFGAGGEARLSTSLARQGAK